MMVKFKQMFNVVAWEFQPTAAQTQMSRKLHVHANKVHSIFQ